MSGDEVRMLSESGILVEQLSLLQLAQEAVSRTSYGDRAAAPGAQLPPQLMASPGFRQSVDALINQDFAQRSRSRLPATTTITTLSSTPAPCNASKIRTPLPRWRRLMAPVLLNTASVRIYDSSGVPSGCVGLLRCA